MSHMQQSSVADSGEERPAAVTKDDDVKVGIFNYPLPPTCVCVLYLLSHSQRLKRRKRNLVLNVKKKLQISCCAQPFATDTR